MAVERDRIEAAQRLFSSARSRLSVFGGGLVSNAANFFEETGNLVDQLLANEEEQQKANKEEQQKAASESSAPIFLQITQEAQHQYKGDAPSEISPPTGEPEVDQWQPQNRVGTTGQGYCETQVIEVGVDSFVNTDVPAPGSPQQCAAETDLPISPTATDRIEVAKAVFGSARAGLSTGLGAAMKTSLSLMEKAGTLVEKVLAEDENGQTKNDSGKLLAEGDGTQVNGLQTGTTEVDQLKTSSDSAPGFGQGDAAAGIQQNIEDVPLDTDVVAVSSVQEALPEPEQAQGDGIVGVWTCEASKSSRTYEVLLQERGTVIRGKINDKVIEGVVEEGPEWYQADMYAKRHLIGRIRLKLQDRNQMILNFRGRDAPKWSKDIVAQRQARTAVDTAKAVLGTATAKLSSTAGDIMSNPEVRNALKRAGSLVNQLRGAAVADGTEQKDSSAGCATPRGNSRREMPVNADSPAASASASAVVSDKDAGKMVSEKDAAKKEASGENTEQTKEPACSTPSKNATSSHLSGGCSNPSKNATSSHNSAGSDHNREVVLPEPDLPRCVSYYSDDEMSKQEEPAKKFNIFKALFGRALTCVGDDESNSASHHRRVVSSARRAHSAGAQARSSRQPARRRAAQCVRCVY